jgi:hypothetical protein
MTNEQINEAIAELVNGNNEGPFPDCCNDLNVMHEAEKTLNFEQSEFFEDELCDVAKKENDVLENPLPWRFSVCHATARQRAKAFLKTIGKWEEQ